MQRVLLVCLFVVLLYSCTSTTSDVSKNTTSNKNYTEEIEKISKQIESNNKDAVLFASRAKLYHKNVQDSLAIADYNKAIALDTTNASYYSAIGDILFEHKDITASTSFIQKAISINPKDETAQLKLAKLFLFAKEYPKAFVAINTVLKGNVYNAEAYFLKGVCYLDMKDSNRAISSFQTAVQTDTKYYDAFILLGNIYTAKKDNIALQYFENAYKCDTSKMEGIYAQGMYYQSQNKYEEAKKVYKRIVLQNKQFPLSYYNTGWILLQQDSIEKAIRQFDIAIQVKPDYADAYFNKALCKEIQGNKKEAIELYTQALQFNANKQLCEQALKRLVK